MGKNQENIDPEWEDDDFTDDKMFNNEVKRKEELEIARAKGKRISEGGLKVEGIKEEELYSENQLYHASSKMAIEDGFEAKYVCGGSEGKDDFEKSIRSREVLVKEKDGVTNVISVPSATNYDAEDSPAAFEALSIADSIKAGVAAANGKLPVNISIKVMESSPPKKFGPFKIPFTGKKHWVHLQVQVDKDGKMTAKVTDSKGRLGKLSAHNKEINGDCNKAAEEMGLTYDPKKDFQREQTGHQGILDNENCGRHSSAYEQQCMADPNSKRTKATEAQFTRMNKACNDIATKTEGSTIDQELKKIADRVSQNEQGSRDQDKNIKLQVTTHSQRTKLGRKAFEESAIGNETADMQVKAQKEQKGIQHDKHQMEFEGDKDNARGAAYAAKIEKRAEAEFGAPEKKKKTQRVGFADGVAQGSAAADREGPTEEQRQKLESKVTEIDNISKAKRRGQENTRPNEGNLDFDPKEKFHQAQAKPEAVAAPEAPAQPKPVFSAPAPKVEAPAPPSPEAPAQPKPVVSAPAPKVEVPASPPPEAPAQPKVEASPSAPAFSAKPKQQQIDGSKFNNLPKNSKAAAAKKRFHKSKAKFKANAGKKTSPTATVKKETSNELGT